jgi:hypothetical protein
LIARLRHVYKGVSNKTCKSYYDTFEQNILKKYFAHVLLVGYPVYLIEMITEKVLYQFKNTKLTINSIVYQFALCASMGILNNHSYQLFLDTIINNIYGVSTIDYEIRFSDDFMRLLTQFKTENVTNLDQFVKFILINQFHSQVWSIETRINTYLSYKNRGEIPLSSYMYAVCDIDHAIRHNYSIVINWKPDAGLDELDQFYLHQLSNL